MRHLAALLGVGLLQLSPADASAQRVLSSVDISGTRVRYADSIDAGGPSVSPALRIDWSRATLSTSADISALAGKASMQGSVAPSIFTPSFGPVFGEVAGSLSGSTHGDGTHTGQVLSVARAYVAPLANGGVWIGGGAGQTWDGSTWRKITEGEAGGWINLSSVTSLFTLTPVRVADTIRYDDLEFALRYSGRAFELGASLGGRHGSRGPVPGETQRVWGTVSALRWLSSRIAVVTSVGSYPVDLTQGFPGGRFASLALRVVSVNTKRATSVLPSSSESRPNSATADNSSIRSFVVRATAGDRRVITVDASRASRVEISGDFTQWQPVALHRGSDGLWTVTQSIPRGRYEVTIRVDGGSWGPPPGLLTSRDELGAVVGILSIE